MKTRKGFVSNSSSSSFVVGFKRDQIPKSPEELQKMLFGTREHVSAYENTVHADEAAKRIFDDIQMHYSHSAYAVQDAIMGGWIDGQPKHTYRWDTKESDEQREQRRTVEDYETAAFHAKKLIEVIEMAKENDLVLYALEYGDENGTFESILEHGDVFDNAPFHLQISKH